jgi:ketol-acid reductoisomerase
MGLLQGAFLAQYEVLRENGHSPSEAYNETIEEALQSLYPLISEKGMDWMYSNCSTTAQRGALDWAPKFKKTLKPVIEDCYKKVLSGEEARRSIKSNSQPNYRTELNKELEEINNQEMWIAGKELRKLRPENL